MPSTATLQVALPTDREIVLTRTFDAPRRLVYARTATCRLRGNRSRIRSKYNHTGRTDCFTKPELLKRWLEGSGGKRMGMSGVYREIVAPERDAHTETFDDYPGIESLVTGVFTEQNGQTTLNATILYPSREVRDAVIKSGMERGAGETYDRLAELLPSLK